MNSDDAGASLRHALTVAGAVAVSYGYMKSDQMSALVDAGVQLVGAAGVISAYIWSLVQKRRQRAAIANEQAKVIALNSQAAVPQQAAKP